MKQRLADLAWLATPLMVAASIICFRMTTLIALGLYLITLFFRDRVRSDWILASTLLWIGTLLAPVDITFKNVPGPPRLVPYLTGLPTSETAQKARRGDVCLGGCVVGPMDPIWVLVW